jgi:hypothetical protein
LLSEELKMTARSSLSVEGQEMETMGMKKLKLGELLRVALSRRL